jgi:hypothetical protein
MTDLSYIPLGQLRNYDLYSQKYTYFNTFAELISPSNNYRAVLYIDNTIPEFQRREINEIAVAYDEHMKRKHDPRRIYRI